MEQNGFQNFLLSYIQINKNMYINNSSNVISRIFLHAIRPNLCNLTKPNLGYNCMPHIKRTDF
jgi:hypothetical protein